MQDCSLCVFNKPLERDSWEEEYPYPHLEYGELIIPDVCWDCFNNLPAGRKSYYEMVVKESRAILDMPFKPPYERVDADKLKITYEKSLEIFKSLFTRMPQIDCHIFQGRIDPVIRKDEIWTMGIDFLWESNNVEYCFRIDADVDICTYFIQNHNGEFEGKVKVSELIAHLKDIGV